MADLKERQYNQYYSGLATQAIIGGCIALICLSSHDYMKRKRRGKRREEGLGSVETWQFGYLFQGRSWAKRPSPPSPLGWPLSWVPQVFSFPPDKLNELRGVDASLYCRFLRGCWWFILSQALTTFPILFPVHFIFSSGQGISAKSMQRASIGYLVQTSKGKSLLWIHMCLMFWIAFCWMSTLVWIARGAFRFRAANIAVEASRVTSEVAAEKDAQYAPHPHPQHAFHSPPELQPDRNDRGIRLRTVMVMNIPPQLRSEKVLKEYFEYYLTRSLDLPAIGVTSTTQPGIINKLVSFVFKQAKHLPEYLPHRVTILSGEPKPDSEKIPLIDRVVIARRMSELAALLERREDFLRRLETAHINLAKRALEGVRCAMDERDKHRRSLLARASTRTGDGKNTGALPASQDVDIERGEEDPEDRMDLLIRTLGPFVEEFGLREGTAHSQRHTKHGVTQRLVRASRRIKHLREGSDSGTDSDSPPTRTYPPTSSATGPSTSDPNSEEQPKTVWDALFSLPRSTLDAYQPLFHLSALFRGKTVPAVDYFTAKLGLLTSLVTEHRSRPAQDFDAVSTAFVTFADPFDARRACKILAVHPEDPLACVVTMAPSYEDLDWLRVMKYTFRVEFLKDWVVDGGVWVFTLLWLFPLSFIVGLVSLSNISTYLPSLSAFLKKHPEGSDFVQSFVPTFLVSLLQLLIPLTLLLIAKKAHTISTLSALHDKILTRYWKFLVVNLLVFFCIGTTGLQTFLGAYKSADSAIQAITTNFPTAGPFYVGWLIFTTAMHGGLEVALLGLPLIVYPTTKRQVTPRKRSAGIRPRTFNYYYWLPNHVFVCSVCLVFAVMNPLVIPPALLYYSSEAVVIKNQLLHVYAKNYEGNGQYLLVRIVRYSLDGLMLAQVVFMAYMIVLRHDVNIAFSAVLIVLTASVKFVLTRMCRAKFEEANIVEGEVVCGSHQANTDNSSQPSVQGTIDRASQIATVGDFLSLTRDPKFWTWRLAPREEFTYSSVPARPNRTTQRQPNPFGPSDSFTRLHSLDALNSPGVSNSSVQPPLMTIPPFGHGPVAQASPNSPSNQKSPTSRAIVIPHAKHPTWDDTPSLDQPYDNPYYTRPISDTLWLPRDPVGLLDLDDTVDVHKSLTSEPGAGNLGEWYEGAPSIGPGFPSSFSTVSVVHDNTTVGSVYELHGDEEIMLPPGIAARVQNIHKEEEVESIRERRTSTFSLPRPPLGRRSSIAGSRQSKSSLRQQSGLRSSSFGSRRANSLMSAIDPDQQLRASSMDPTTASAFRARSHLSIPRPQSTFSNGSPAITPGGLVTTREAVVGEVLAEEQQAAEERMEDEQAELAEAQGRHRSWWTAWMYSRPV